MVQGILLLGSHVVHETHHSVVVKFVVNELDKVVVENNASPGIKDRRVGAAV